MSYTLRSPWSLFALTVAAGLMSVSAARAAPHSQMVKPAYRYIDCSHTKTAAKDAVPEKVVVATVPASTSGPIALPCSRKPIR